MLDWIDVVDGSWPSGAHSVEFAILNNNGGVGVIRVLRRGLAPARGLDDRRPTLLAGLQRHRGVKDGDLVVM